ncbi:hypothetical protein LX64_02932 [Chitinophaga skermanii]|uniref:Tetratricopeptide repeat protein n=2 Tax=Chitinophaga skermanii TaxID=331697 RepID=A0A327QJ86_9BACT|nr:hypothetical protein LX64_02932 [Chitinophaga skermanii]
MNINIDRLTMFLSWWYDYYYIVIVFQLLFLWHALKTQRRDYIWILIFLPVIGGLIYLFKEFIPSVRSSSFSAQMKEFFKPAASIEECQKRVRIADTVTNRLALADAYSKQKQYERAIATTQSCLTDYHAKDPGITLQLARLHFLNNQFEQSIAYFDRIAALNQPMLKKQDDELMYTRALVATGQTARAEEEFKRIIRVHHSIEAMYYYGMFLKKQSRFEEAKEQFTTAKTEIDLHPRYIRRQQMQWVRLSKKELASL